MSGESSRDEPGDRPGALQPTLPPRHPPHLARRLPPPRPLRPLAAGLTAPLAAGWLRDRLRPQLRFSFPPGDGLGHSFGEGSPFLCRYCLRLVSYFFYAHTARLVAVQVRPLVFSVQVASEAVARLTTAAGVGAKAAVQLRLHLSVDASRAMVELTLESLANAPPAAIKPAFNAHGRLRSLSAWRRLPPRSCLLAHMPDPIAGNVKPPDSPGPRAALPGCDPAVSILGSFTRCPAADDAPLPPDSDTGLNVGARRVTPLSSPGLASVKGDRSPYRAALLSPAAPHRCSQPHPPPSPLSLHGCFRCLSTRHFMKDCWNPVRCRRCHHSGHRTRSRSCSMAPPRPTVVPSSLGPPTHSTPRLRRLRLLPADRPLTPPPLVTPSLVRPLPWPTAPRG
ncbi:hypothetical protein ZWY2020_055633 [Hordeum vulgare]|nr:hypothetical protein ZWY2020_055633 [Hordeum vulgare]